MLMRPVTLLTVAVAAALVIAPATPTDARPRKRRRRRRRPRARTKPKQVAPTPPPATTTPPAKTAGANDKPGVDLSLLDCAARALKRDANLQIKRIDVRETHIDEDAGLGNMYPTVTAGVNFANLDQATPFTFADSDGLFTTRQLTYNAGINGLTPFGLKYALVAQSSVLFTTQSAAVLSPQHVNQWSLTLTQSLLKGRSWLSNTQKLEVARADRARYKGDIKTLVATTLQKVVAAYWELVAKRRIRGVSERALELAKAQLKATERRVKLGNLSRLELIEAKAGIANARKELVAANVDVIAAERALLLLIYDPKNAGAGGKALMSNLELKPTDTPTGKDLGDQLPALIQRALEQRPELGALKAQIKARRVERAANDNLALPTLDLSASIGGTSLTGSDARPEFVVGSNPPRRQDPLPDQITGAHGNAWGQALGFKLPQFTVGVKFEMPLSGDLRRQQREKASLAIARVRRQLNELHATIAVEVRDALRRAKLAERQVEATVNRAKLTRENLDAMNRRFRGGVVTSFDVLRVQVDVSKADQEVIEAQKTLAVARAELARSLGELPQYVGVDIKK